MLVTLYTASVIVGVGAARKFIFFEIFLFLIVGDPTLFSHLWYVHRSLISDTPNPEINYKISSAHANNNYVPESIENAFRR